MKKWLWTIPAILLLLQLIPVNRDNPWGRYPADKQHHKLEESAEVIGNGEMPMKNYTWAHPEPRLMDAQRRELVAWFSGQHRAAPEDDSVD